MKQIRHNKKKIGHLTDGHRKAGTVGRDSAVKLRRIGADRHMRVAGHGRPGEKTKGQSALASAVAEDELEERRRLFAKARKGNKGAMAKIYELYGARIYTPAQVKGVRPAGRVGVPDTVTRRRARA